MVSLLSWLAQQCLSFVLTDSTDTPCDELTGRLPVAQQSPGFVRWLQYWLRRAQGSEWQLRQWGVRVSTLLQPPMEDDLYTETIADNLDLLLPLLWSRVMPNASALIVEGLGADANGHDLLAALLEASLPKSTHAAPPLLYLTRLTMSDCEISLCGAAQLATLCSSPYLPNLREVLLDNTALTTASFVRVVDGLRARQQALGPLAGLDCLSVRGNLLRAEALPAVVSALYTHRSVRTVDLSYNACLFRETLRDGTGEQEGPLSADVARSLDALLLGGLCTTPPAIVASSGANEVTASNSGITVNLTGCVLSAAILASLQRSRQLVALPLHTLDLSYVRLPHSEGMAALLNVMAATRSSGSLVHLVSLSLRGTGLSADSMGVLATVLALQSTGKPYEKAALPSLRRLDVSQSNAAESPGLEAAAGALLAAMVHRWIVSSSPDRGGTAAAPSFGPATVIPQEGFSLGLERCGLSGEIVTATRASLATTLRLSVASHAQEVSGVPAADGGASAECHRYSHWPRFSLFLGLNQLTKRDFGDLRDSLSTCTPHELLDVYVEGNPVSLSLPDHLARASICVASPAPPLCLERLVLNPAAHLHDDALREEVMTERVDADVAAHWLSASRRGSVMGVKASGAEQTRLSSSPSVRQDTPLPRDVPIRNRRASAFPPVGANDLKPRRPTAPQPVLAEPVALDHGALVQTADAPAVRQASRCASQTNPLPHCDPQPTFFDAAEMAQLMEETAAIMRDRLDVMPDSSEPF